MASVFHHLLAALCFADLLFLISLVVVSPVTTCINIVTLILYFVLNHHHHIGDKAMMMNYSDNPHQHHPLPCLDDHDHAQVALGMPGFPLWLYHLAECFCHLGLAASVFLTIAITIERYQVRMMMMAASVGNCIY